MSISRYNSETLEDPNFRHVRKTAKSDYWLPHVCLHVCGLPCVRPSAWNNSAPTGRIVITFDMSIFRIYVYKIQV
jgi:hypothetical protein